MKFVATRNMTVFMFAPNSGLTLSASRPLNIEPLTATNPTASSSPRIIAVTQVSLSPKTPPLIMNVPTT